jgi:hypothetical protein
MEKKCDRCGKPVYWQQSKKGYWYLVGENGKPHKIQCGEDGDRLARATRLKRTMDESFERAIAQ